MHARTHACVHAHTQHAVRKDHDSSISTQLTVQPVSPLFRSTSSFSISVHALAQLLGPRKTAQQASSPFPEVDRNFLLGQADPGRGPSHSCLPEASIDRRLVLYHERYCPRCTGLPGKRIPARRNLQPGAGNQDQQDLERQAFGAGLELPDVITHPSHFRVDPPRPLASWHLSPSLSSSPPIQSSCSCTMLALGPPTVLAQYQANGQNGLEEGREGVCLGIEKCLTRPQGTALSEGQPPSIPPPSLEREEIWTLEAATSHAPFPRAHTCADVCTPPLFLSSSPPTRGW